MMRYQTFDKLHCTKLDAEQHERHGPYWFIVTNGAMSHTAFATRAGLDRWLGERGLSLETDLPMTSDKHATTRITGEYRTVMHGGPDLPWTDPDRYPGMSEGDDWEKLAPVLVTVAMSNGRYTLALITEEDGIRYVHTLNPNVKTRVEFDWRRMVNLPA